MQDEVLKKPIGPLYSKQDAFPPDAPTAEGDAITAVALERIRIIDAVDLSDYTSSSLGHYALARSQQDW